MGKYFGKYNMFKIFVPRKALNNTIINNEIIKISNFSISKFKAFIKLKIKITDKHIPNTFINQ